MSTSCKLAVRCLHTWERWRLTSDQVGPRWSFAIDALCAINLRRRDFLRDFFYQVLVIYSMSFILRFSADVSVTSVTNRSVVGRPLANHPMFPNADKQFINFKLDKNSLIADEIVQRFCSTGLPLNSTSEHANNIQQPTGIVECQLLFVLTGQLICCKVVS